MHPDATRPARPIDRSMALAQWSRLDLAGAVHQADRDVVEESQAVRALIVDLAASSSQDELFDACAVLGRFFAERGASPTLASATIDHAARAIHAHDAPWVPPARAVLAEGFASALVEAAQRAALQAWEFAGCAVPLGEGAMAVAAGHPADDGEALAAWASRVARDATRKGIRRAVVSGGDRACAAMLDALRLVGIEAKRMS